VKPATPWTGCLLAGRRVSEKRHYATLIYLSANRRLLYKAVDIQCCREENWLQAGAKLSLFQNDTSRLIEDKIVN